MKIRYAILSVLLLVFATVSLYPDGAVNVIGGIVDFTSLTRFVIPNSAGATATVNGSLKFDTTGQMYHAGQSSADAMIPTFTATPTNGNCASWSVSGSTYKLGDFGSACGGGGGGAGTSYLCSSYVPTQEGTTSTTFTDLATVDGCSFIVTSTTTVSVIYIAQEIESLGGREMNNIVNVDGSDVAATNFPLDQANAGYWLTGGAAYSVSLASGSHTIKVRHKVLTDGTGTWANRQLIISVAGQINSTLFAQTASATVGNTTVETSVFSTGVGSVTIPANYLVAGKNLKLRVLGFHSAAGNPTIQWRFKIAGTTVLDTGAISSQTSTNQALNLLIELTCRSTGVTGTIMGQGVYTETGNTSATSGMVMTSPTTINTTGSLTLDLTAQWGTMAVGDTLTVTNVILEAL